MSGKLLVQMETPTTQKTDAVEALATYLKKPIESGVLDLGDIKLVRSHKGDAFYGVTARKCSCPAQTFSPAQPCKHQRQHFPGPRKSREELEAEGEAELASHDNRARRLAKSPQDSIRPDGKWPHGCNGPVNLPEPKVVA
jgi:hypothetical protein